MVQVKNTGRMGKGLGPSRRHIYLGGSRAGDQTQLQCSKPSSMQLSKGESPSVTKRTFWGISPQNLGEEIFLSSQYLVSDSLIENKTPAPGKGKLLGAKKPKTWAVTRVARTGKGKKLMCIVYLQRPYLQNLQKQLHQLAYKSLEEWNTMAQVIQISRG